MKPKKLLCVLGLVTFIISCACNAFSQEHIKEAIISEKKIRVKDGPTICVVHDPKTKCEMAVDCEDPTNERPHKKLQDIFRIGNNPLKYIEIPGDPCQTFIADDGVPGNTTYYCSGGKCYPY